MDASGTHQDHFGSLHRILELIFVEGIVAFRDTLGNRQIFGCVDRDFIIFFRIMLFNLVCECVGLMMADVYVIALIVRLTQSVDFGIHGHEHLVLLNNHLEHYFHPISHLTYLKTDHPIKNLLPIIFLKLVSAKLGCLVAEFFKHV